MRQAMNAVFSQTSLWYLLVMLMDPGMKCVGNVVLEILWSRCSFLSGTQALRCTVANLRSIGHASVGEPADGSFMEVVTVRL